MKAKAKEPRRPHRFLRWKWVLYAVLVLLLFFSVMEISLRLSGFTFARRDKLDMLSRLHARWVGTEDYVRDSRLLFRLRPGSRVFEENYLANARGFRGQNFDLRKAPGTVRILCLGNSCTFGLRVPRDADVYPARLQTLLEACLPRSRVEVVNAAIPGHSSYQGLRFLKSEAVGYEPDVITVYFGWNDLLWSHDREDKEHGYLLLKMAALRDVVRVMRVYQLLDWTICYLSPAARQRGALALKRRVMPADFRANLREIARFAKLKGIPCVLMTGPCLLNSQGFPKTFRWLSPPEDLFQYTLDDRDQYNQIIRDVAAEMAAPLLDLANIFSASDLHLFDYKLVAEPDSSPCLVTGDTVHPNPLGHQEIAEELVELLLRERLVSSVPAR